jgi:hypothetical protein
MQMPFHIQHIYMSLSPIHVWVWSLRFDLDNTYFKHTSLVRDYVLSCGQAGLQGFAGEQTSSLLIEITSKWCITSMNSGVHF